jgi:hypothetical protein
VTRKEVRVVGRTVELRGGYGATSIHMTWARIRNGRAGDGVWLDWSKNGGRDWYQCGPFYVGHQQSMRYTRAVQHLWTVRACGRADGQVECTGWAG